MAWPAVKKAFSQEEFRAHVATLQWSRWRPSLIVLHNTAAPTWAQWHKTAEQDRAAGKVPGSSRIDSMENYFRDEKGWSGAPHLFVPEDRIWEFNPLTEPGVHSPSWNHVSIGIEMVADFDREDDGSGPGLLVRRNAVFAAAVLCSALGLEPRAQVKLHREDPKTTHACPGEYFALDREFVIAEIADGRRRARPARGRRRGPGAGRPGGPGGGARRHQRRRPQRPPGAGRQQRIDRVAAEGRAARGARQGQQRRDRLAAGQDARGARGLGRGPLRHARRLTVHRGRARRREMR
jgi:hypothetical protein